MEGERGSKLTIRTDTMYCLCAQALCETLEESMYTLRQELQEKEIELSLLKEELELYKSQVELLSTRLR